MVRGNEIWLSAKPVPVTATADMTKSALPVFVTRIVFVLVVPTVTPPNERLVGVTLTEMEVPVPPPATTPVLPQPASKKGSITVRAVMPGQKRSFNRMALYLITSSSHLAFVRRKQRELSQLLG